MDGILERIFAELGVKPRVIATGGLARMIAADSRHIHEIDDMLTLDGLRILFERNRTRAPAQPRTLRRAVRNYFNYFTEIEERFQQRRGSLLLLSTLDWALIETWREAGIPLEAALRGIDAAFDKYEARQKRGRMRRVNGLAWCAQAVMEAAEELREAAAGATPATAENRESGFEHERVAAHLEAAAASLDACGRCSGRLHGHRSAACSNWQMKYGVRSRRAMPRTIWKRSNARLRFLKRSYSLRSPQPRRKNFWSG